MWAKRPYPYSWVQPDSNYMLSDDASVDDVAWMDMTSGNDHIIIPFNGLAGNSGNYQREKRWAPGLRGGAQPEINTTIHRKFFHL